MPDEPHIDPTLTEPLPGTVLEEPYLRLRPHDQTHFALHIAEPRITMLQMDVTGVHAEDRVREALSGELPVAGAFYVYVCTEMVQEDDHIRAKFQLCRLRLRLEPAEEESHG